MYNASLYLSLFPTPLQAGESVLSALAGCKILRELSKLESETETKLSMKELAQKFENLALGGLALSWLCVCTVRMSM